MTNEPTNDNVNDDLWIDFIEDELDPSLREDMQRLLARSAKDSATHSRYETLREALEGTVDVRAENVVLESFDFEALHAKIMEQIPDETFRDRRLPARRPSANRTLRRLSARARNVVLPSLMGGLLIMSFVFNHLTHLSELEAREMDFGQHLVASSAPGQVVEGRTILGEDLATAVASAKLERMTDREARALIQAL